MMESCGIYQWNIIYARVRSVNINERIANEKAETKNSFGYVATFSNAFIISVYVYISNWTYRISVLQTYDKLE